MCLCVNEEYPVEGYFFFFSWQSKLWLFFTTHIIYKCDIHVCHISTKLFSKKMSHKLPNTFKDAQMPRVFEKNGVLKKMFWKPADRFRLFSLLQLNQYWTTHASHQQHIYRYLKGANLSAWIWIPSIKSYAAEKKVNIGRVLRHHLQYSSYTLFTTICMDAFEWAVVSTVNVTALFTVFFSVVCLFVVVIVEPNFSLQFESNRIFLSFFEKNSEK